MAVDADPTLPAAPAEPAPVTGALPGGGVATATLVGRSPWRRTAGLAGQYAVLVLLAAVVLAPLVFTVIQAMSTPTAYFEAGNPPHPVAVDWKDRTWFDGGPWSVVLRTGALLALLVTLQLKAAGGGVRRLAPLGRPAQLLAVGGGLVAVMLTTGPILTALADRSSAATAWFLGSMALVAATQLVGLAGGRRLWEAVVLAACSGVGLVGGVVVAIGAATWTNGWDEANLGPAMTRSLAVTLMITLCQVVTSILAAYAFAFLRFPLKGLLFAFFMGSLLLPIEVTLIANDQAIRSLGWIDTNQALVLPFAATAFGTFLIRQGFRGVPPEIRDAARLDGYGHLAFLWRFAVPLTRPVIAAFTVISAMGAWNQYLWPRAVIDDSTRTTQIALENIARDDPNRMNVAIAAALLVAVPVVLLLIAFQRHIIRGLTAGAVKG